MAQKPAISVDIRDSVLDYVTVLAGEAFARAIAVVMQRVEVFPGRTPGAQPPAAERRAIANLMVSGVNILFLTLSDGSDRLRSLSVLVRRRCALSCRSCVLG